MSFLDDIIDSDEPVKGPYFGILYGPAGCGKTFLCQHAESPYYIPLEKGCEKLPKGVGRPINKDGKIIMPSTADEFFQLLQYVGRKFDTYKTAVIDSGMFADKLFIEKYIIENSVEYEPGKRGIVRKESIKQISSIGDFDYGVGYAGILSIWETRFFRALNVLHNKGMNVILIAHARERNTRDINGDEYKKWGIDMAQFGIYSVPNLLSAKADWVLFMRSECQTQKKANQFGGVARTVADNSFPPQITVYTRGASAFDAKVRTEKLSNVQDSYFIDINDPETSKQLFRDLDK